MHLLSNTMQRDIRVLLLLLWGRIVVYYIPYVGAVLQQECRFIERGRVSWYVLKMRTFE